MIFKKKYSFILVILFFIVVGFFLISPGYLPRKTSDFGVNFVKIGEKNIKVDLAITGEEQARGLSGRKNIKEDEGMLFIFPKPGKFNFWMKDMNFPIDIIWINDNFEIIYIKKHLEPSSYPESFGPDVDNRYVLEVSAGFSEKNNLETGNKVKFLP